jgi:hypothetical protein
MTRLGIINLWGGWSITAGIIMNMGISYEGVASAHIVLDLCLYRSLSCSWINLNVQKFYNFYLPPPFYGSLHFFFRLTSLMGIE